MHKETIERRISPVIAYIETHLEEQLNVEDLAELACYSKFHFIRLFASVTGFTVLDYIKRRRLAEAARALVTSKESILSIAIRFQYDSQERFGRAFKSVFSDSPGHFRKKGHRVNDFKNFVLSPKSQINMDVPYSTVPDIITIEPRTLVGQTEYTNLATHNSRQFWQNFVQVLKMNGIALQVDFYSVQIMEKMLSLEEFTPKTMFHKWAALEKTKVDSIPEGFQTYTLDGGLYAVFLHRGPAQFIHKTMTYILQRWLPNSEYTLDHRNQFEIMGSDYHGPQHPDSQEEVWIPIQPK